MPKGRFFILAAAFLFSGTCALAYQVVWARMLSLVFGSTNQAISTVLAVFMLGLALGSHFGGRISRRGRNLGRLYGLLEIVLGLYALACPILLSQAATIHDAAFAAAHDSEALLALYRLLIAFGLLLIPTSLMGATLPVLAQYIENDTRKAGSKIGLLYAINTFGAALGAFSSAFLSIPYYGLNWTVAIAASLNIAIGIVCVVALHDTSGTASEEQHHAHAPGKKPAKKIESHSAGAQAIPFAVPVCVLFLVGTIGMLLENRGAMRSSRLRDLVYAFATMLTAYLVGSRPAASSRPDSCFATAPSDSSPPCSSSTARPFWPSPRSSAFCRHGSSPSSAT
jgi:spermidine synthase